MERMVSPVCGLSVAGRALRLLYTRVEPLFVRGETGPPWPSFSPMRRSPKLLLGLIEESWFSCSWGLTAARHPLTCCHVREGLKPRRSPQTRRRTAEHASSKLRPKLSAGALSRMPAEKMHPRAALLVQNDRPDAWSHQGEQEHARRLSDGGKTRFGAAVPGPAAWLATLCR